MGENVNVTARRTGKNLRMVEWFNEACPVGSPVYYWPGAREGEPRKGATRSEAWLLGGHSPVVLVEGYAGAIALSHVMGYSPGSTGETGASKETDRRMKLTDAELEALGFQTPGSGGLLARRIEAIMAARLEPVERENIANALLIQSYAERAEDAEAALADLRAKVEAEAGFWTFDLPQVAKQLRGLIRKDESA